MQITNRFNLPQTLMNAIERDPYSMGDARISVTGLLKPPRIGLLFKKHARDITTDVSDNIWSIFGRAVHQILEAGGDEEHLPEERLFAEVRGWRVSGALDMQHLGGNAVKIVDYKTTSAWATMNDKPDWEQQLNLYGWLIRTAKDMEVQSLAICAFVRDWSRHEAARNPDYPQAPAVMIDIPMWTHEQVTAFVDERVRIHQEAQASWDMGEQPPECSDDERWMRKPRYAVMKTGGKRATKVYDSANEAAEHVAKLGAAYQVDTRKPEPIRCTNDYCNVSQWCGQYAAWKLENPA